MYTSVRGWINFHGDDQQAVIRQAIAVAAERSPERAREADRAHVREHATQIAAGWQFLGSGVGGLGGQFAFWAGRMRNEVSYLIRDQVEAVATVLKVEHNVRPDGWIGYDLQGLFDVRAEERPPVEWRIYGGALHENEREVPLSDEQRVGWPSKPE